ncbi:MAG TPA: hypothetical protein VGO50_11540 [Pyrinomonadaceae bacterium]|nr:hypothetical protein [Pyrinomonadaceae bacterium]
MSFFLWNPVAAPTTPSAEAAATPPLAGGELTPGSDLITMTIYFTYGKTT